MKQPVLTAVLFASAIATGCSEPETDNSEDPNAPPSDPVKPSDPSYSGRKLDCERREALVSACNLDDNRLRNIATGATDLFAPSDLCVAQLDAVFPLDASWKSDLAARSAMLTGLHALLFYPVAAPVDHVLIWDGSNVTFTDQLIADFGLIPIYPVDDPQTKDIPLKRSYYNEKILDWVYGEVDTFSMIEYGAHDYTHAQTEGHTVSMVRTYVKIPDSTLAEEAYRLAIARTIIHETIHAWDSAADHHECPSPSLVEECDNNVADSGYGIGTMIGHALVLGTAVSRVWEDASNAPIVTEGVLSDFYKNNCTSMFQRVEAVKTWVKAHDPNITMCAGVPANMYVPNLFAQRYENPTGAGGGGEGSPAGGGAEGANVPYTCN